MTSIILPGDVLPSSSSTSNSIHLGPGLYHPPSTSSAPSSSLVARAHKAGLLGHLTTPDNAKGKGKGAEKWWVEGKSKRYIPHPPEPVIGIIVARHAEGYRVDIGSSAAASLDALAFEGATKRSKPNLKIGAVVYAHLLSTPDFSEPEISCVDETTQKSAGFGELTEGFLLRGVELGRCRALLSNQDTTLSKLGSRFPFEVAVGMNGRIWVKVEGEDKEEKTVDLVGELKGR